MANNTDPDPDQLASSESRSALFVKAGHIQVQQDLGKKGRLRQALEVENWQISFNVSNCRLSGYQQLLKNWFGTKLMFLWIL